MFKGIRNATQEIVAIKVLPLDSEDIQLDDIHKEIQLLAACDSPYITKHYGSLVTDNKTIWIITEYAGAGSIRDILKSGAIPEKYIILIIKDVCQALKYLHKVQILHRSIKYQYKII